MPILFSAVAYERTVISKHACCDGNFDDVLMVVINKTAGDGKMTYHHGQYLLHYITESGHLYFCITDKLCQRSRAFLFLKEIKRRNRERNKTCCTRTLAEQMMYYNDDESTIIIGEGDIDEINSIGVDSSESLLGEKILVVQNDHDLQYSTVSYADIKPQTVVIPLKKTNYTVYVTASLVIAIALFVISPAAFVIVILIAILYYIFR